MDSILRVLLVAGMAMFGFQAFKLARVAYLLRAGKHVRKRVLQPDFSLPESLIELDEAVRNLGFEQQHCNDLYLTGQGKKPVRMWNYSHADFGIGAGIQELAANPSFYLSFETVFPDDSMIVTTYPRGHEFDAAKLHLGFATQSLAEAFDHQCLKVLAWSAERGDPVVPTTPEEMAVTDDRMLTLHGRKLYAPFIRQAIGSAVNSIGFMLLLIVFSWDWLFLGGFEQAVNDAPDSVSTVSQFLAPALWFPVILLAAILLIIVGFAYSRPKKPSKSVDADAAPPIDPTVHPLHRPERRV